MPTEEVHYRGYWIALYAIFSLEQTWRAIIWRQNGESIIELPARLSKIAVLDEARKEIDALLDQPEGCLPCSG